MVGDFNYEKLLKDPRWILKRLIILKRDNYRCTTCGSRKRLQVHHTYYSGGYNPWEYPDEDLITLCEVCHKKYHEEHEVIFMSHPKGSPKKIRKPKRIRSKKVKRKKFIKRKPFKAPLALQQKVRRSEKYRRKVDGEWVVFKKPRDGNKNNSQ